MRRLLLLGILLVIVFVSACQVTEKKITDKSLEIETEGDIMITNGVKHLVPLDKILGGGPPKDGIPSIDKPKFTSVEEADKWLNDDDLVLGLVRNGVARAYPFRIMNWHEIVNEKIKNEAILITYCPLCRTGLAFESKINNEEVEFGTSGKLFNSNLVMYDRKTDSYWSQVTGQAIVGELTGMKLKRIALDTLPWQNWKEEHPDSLILSRDTGHIRDYNRDPYAGYEKRSSVLFPLENRDDRLHSKTIVVGIELNGKQKAYPQEDVRKVGLINDEFADTQLLVVFDEASAVVKIFERELEGNVLEFKLENKKLIDNNGDEWSFYGEGLGEAEGKELKPVLTDGGSFWFSWFSFFPDTELFLA